MVPNPNPLFEDGPGTGLDPVDGEFQPSFETGYPGGGAYLIYIQTGYFRIKHQLPEPKKRFYSEGSMLIPNAAGASSPFPFQDEKTRTPMVRA